jgi:hypothetical protein
MPSTWFARQYLRYSPIDITYIQLNNIEWQGACAMRPGSSMPLTENISFNLILIKSCSSGNTNYIHSGKSGCGMYNRYIFTWPRLYILIVLVLAGICTQSHSIPLANALACIRSHTGVLSVLETRRLHVYEEVVSHDRRYHECPACCKCHELGLCKLNHQRHQQVVQEISRYV